MAKEEISATVEMTRTDYGAEITRTPDANHKESESIKLCQHEIEKIAELLK